MSGTTPPTICPACQRPVPASDTSCPSCGAPVATGTSIDDTAAFQRFYTSSPTSGGGGIRGWLRRLFSRS